MWCVFIVVVWMSVRNHVKPRKGGGGEQEEESGEWTSGVSTAAKQSISSLSLSLPYITDPPFSLDTMMCVIYQTRPHQALTCVCVYTHETHTLLCLFEHLDLLSEVLQGRKTGRR